MGHSSDRTPTTKSWERIPKGRLVERSAADVGSDALEVLAGLATSTNSGDLAAIAAEYGLQESLLVHICRQSEWRIGNGVDSKGEAFSEADRGASMLFETWFQVSLEMSPQDTTTASLPLGFLTSLYAAWIYELYNEESPSEPFSVFAIRWMKADAEIGWIASLAGLQPSQVTDNTSLDLTDLRRRARNRTGFSD